MKILLDTVLRLIFCRVVVWEENFSSSYVYIPLAFFLFREMGYDGVVLESWSRWMAYLHDPDLRALVGITCIHCLILCCQDYGKTVVTFIFIFLDE